MTNSVPQRAIHRVSQTRNSVINESYYLCDLLDFGPNITGSSVVALGLVRDAPSGDIHS